MTAEIKNLDLSTLSLVIYQNELFIDGLYQAVYEGIMNETTAKETSKTTKSGKVKLEGATSGLLPIKSNASTGGAIENESTNAYTQKMTYSNAFRLHKVRQSLYSSNYIKQLKTKNDVEDVHHADFIEFKASFDNNEFSDLLDLITPELGGILGYFYYLDELKKSQKENPETKFEEHDSNGRVALGRSTIEALHKEFRNDKSAEFYGHIENIDASAILVCDKQFFTNGDSDRLLDGTFTVLGKVIAINKSGSGFSKFERNKILKRIKPDGLQWVHEKLKGLKDVNSYLDTDIELTVDGLAIKVIPIAVYV